MDSIWPTVLKPVIKILLTGIGRTGGETFAWPK